MLERIYHLGVAVRSLEETIPLYRDVLGMRLGGIEEVPGWGVRVAFLEIGESRIELLEPVADGMIARHLAAHGPGLHHVAYEVADLAAALRRCEAAGVRPADGSPRPGAHGALVAFLEPAGTHGVVTELCQLRHRREGSTP